MEFEQMIEDMRRTIRFRDLTDEQAAQVTKVFVEYFSDVANAGMGSNMNKNVVDPFVEQFLREHRTLQQGMLRGIHSILAKLGSLVKEDKSRYTDGRNESSMNWCIKVAEDNEYFPLI